MDERGWGWTPSQIRQVRLIEWIAGQSAGRPELYVDVKSFYDALPDQGSNSSESAHADLKLLEGQRLVAQASGIGGIEALAAMVTPDGCEYLEGLRARRSNRVRRRTACRDAMVAWLYSSDATNDAKLPLRDAMLKDPQYGTWLGQSFLPADLADASAWLLSQALVRGSTVAGDPGPVRLHLTDAGIACAEGFDSDAGRYLDRRAGHGFGPVVSIANNSGPLQVSGDYAHQVQNTGVGAEHLRDLIVGIAEIVRATVPGADEDGAEEAMALSAIGDDGHVAEGALVRFGNWALSTAKAGATNGVVAVISSATTALLMQRGHLG